MEILYIALEQVIIFLPLVIGIYLSYKILQITDLTVDGTFVLGGAVYARCLSMSIDPIICLFLALLGGFLGGMMVALIQFKDKINSLISSILALFILYSINFQIMGRANISLLNCNTLVYSFGEKSIFLMSLLAPISVILLLSSNLGLKLRGLGSNKYLTSKIMSNIELLKIVGLGISNMLAAFCGVMTVEINGYADINMGFGMALTAIGSVVIGLDIVRRIYLSKKIFNATVDIIGCLIGGFAYFLSLNILLKIGIEPINLKLFLGIMLVLMLRTIGRASIN
ncbi:MAG: ABC transporter permease [Legionellales bacterium]|nr:ABC transporter permease [Legionellales bacterium]